MKICVETIIHLVEAREREKDVEPHASLSMFLWDLNCLPATNLVYQYYAIKVTVTFLFLFNSLHLQGPLN